jgi:hypothetical protein
LRAVRYPTIRLAKGQMSAQAVSRGQTPEGIVSALAPRLPQLRPGARRVAQVQSAYYLFTGIWPLLSRRSFEAITGRKQEFWLVQTVGALVGVTGAALALAARDERALQTPAIKTLAIGSALSLATIDLAFVVRGRISPIYLADAAAELGLVAGWLAPDIP